MPRFTLATFLCLSLSLPSPNRFTWLPLSLCISLCLPCKILLNTQSTLSSVTRNLMQLTAALSSPLLFTCTPVYLNETVNQLTSENVHWHPLSALFFALAPSLSLCWLIHLHLVSLFNRITASYTQIQLTHLRPRCMSELYCDSLLLLFFSPSLSTQWPAEGANQRSSAFTAVRFQVSCTECRK